MSLKIKPQKYIEILQTEIRNSTDFELTTFFRNQNYEQTQTRRRIKVPTIYHLPKFHKSPYKYGFIFSSSHWSTTRISILFTNALNTIKNLIEVLDQLHAHVGPFGSVQSFDFSTLYTLLPHDIHYS